MENTNTPWQETAKLLRASDVAAILNVSRALAYRLMQNGTIPSVRVAGAVRVEQADLQAYIAASKSPSTR